jgi:hypothetical protein
MSYTTLQNNDDDDDDDDQSLRVLYDFALDDDDDDDDDDSSCSALQYCSDHQHGFCCVDGRMTFSLLTVSPVEYSTSTTVLW